jgi:hypothetical protein
LLPLFNFEWVVLAMSGRAAGVKGGRSPAQRTLDAGCLPGTLADMADAACCRIGPDEQERFVCMTGCSR